MAGSPASANRLMCSTSPAATANRRSGRIIWPASAARTARCATRSRTSTAAAMLIRRRAAKASCKEQGKRASPGSVGRRTHRLRGPKVSPPTAATAPHLAGVATIEVIKARSDATAVPVAGDEPDAFACGPAETRRRPRRESGAVDDEIAAVGGLHDLDHVLLGRQRVLVLVVVLVVPRARVVHVVREGRRGYQHGQRERRHPFQHDVRLPADAAGRIEAIFSAAKGTRLRDSVRRWGHVANFVECTSLIR